MIYYRTQVGDVKKNDLPGIEALDEPGKKEGQVIIVKANNGTVEAHQVRLPSLQFMLYDLLSWRAGTRTVVEFIKNLAKDW